MEESVSKKSTVFEKFLRRVEILGNKMPDPMLMFIVLAVAVVVASAICSALGVSAVNPTTGETVTVVNLLSKSGMLRMLTSAVTNFTGMSALGLTLTCMLGVGLCEASGLFSVALHGMASSSKGSDIKIIAIFTFVCIMADCTGGAGFVVMPPLGALIWAAMGRNPMAGMLAAYASVSGAFASNLMVTSMDVVNMSYTEASAKLINPAIELTPAMNWWFSAVSVLFLTAFSVLITVKVVEPRLGKYNGDFVAVASEKNPRDGKGLKMAGLSFIIYISVIAALTVTGVLCDAETGSAIASSAPLMKGLTILIALMFAIPGIVFGYSSGRFSSFKDVAAGMSNAMAGMGNYIALFFFIAQFLSYFGWSNLGLILAIGGANALEASGLPIWVVLVLFVIMCGFLNLLIGSASTKWSLLSSVFVPMFMLLGYHPALVQMAYRIGDAISNPICPTFAYFGMLLALAQKYDKKAGFGTLMSNMLPYVICYFIFMVVQLLIWFFFRIPFGPNGPVLYIG